MFRPDLRTRLILYFLPLILGMVIQGGYCIYILSIIHNHFEKMQRNTITDVYAMLELRELLLSLDKGIRNRQVDSAQIRAKIKQVGEIIKSHERHLHKFMNYREQAAHEILHHAIFATTLSKYILAQSKNGWPGDSVEFSRTADTIRKELSALEAVGDQHLQQHIRQLSRIELFISRQYRHALIVITLTGITVFILTISVFYFLIRSVLGPVKTLIEATRQIGAGNLDFRPKITSGDEFEYVANEFVSMAERLANFHQELDRKVRERTQDLIKTNKKLKKAGKQIHNLSQKLIAIQESERQQISLYLHDRVAQNLSALKIACDSIFLDKTYRDMINEQELQEWKRLISHCIKTVRELTYNLRPPGLEQTGLACAIADYCHDFSQKTCIPVQFTGAGVENLSLDFDSAINVYRLVQEALNNVKKHANATEVYVGLIASYPNIILYIEDNGCGFDLEDGYRRAFENRRFGLLGMRERVRMIKGKFEIQSAPGQGTKIVIEFPGPNSPPRGNLQPAGHKNLHWNLHSPTNQVLRKDEEFSAY